MSRRRVQDGRTWMVRALVSTPRRRRLTFVVASAPGLLSAAFGPQVSHDPVWLGLGLLLLFAVLLARHLSEPRFLALEALASAAAPAKEGPSHDT